MGKGALSAVASYIFLSITTRTYGWKQRRQLLKTNPLNQKEYKKTFYREEERQKYWVLFLSYPLCLVLCRQFLNYSLFNPMSKKKKKKLKFRQYKKLISTSLCWSEAALSSEPGFSAPVFGSLLGSLALLPSVQWRRELTPGTCNKNKLTVANFRKEPTRTYIDCAVFLFECKIFIMGLKWMKSYKYKIWKLQRTTYQLTMK